nr:unnamed protein product [Digitaria exilis]
MPLLPAGEVAGGRLRHGEGMRAESLVALELEGGGLEGVGGERPEEVQELRGHAQLLVLLGRCGGLARTAAASPAAASPAAKRP